MLLEKQPGSTGSRGFFKEVDEDDDEEDDEEEGTEGDGPVLPSGGGFR